MTVKAIKKKFLACLKENCEKWISDNDWTWLQYNLVGWNVGEQAQSSQQRLGSKVVERLRCSVCTSVNRLYITNANQINSSANQIEID